MRKGDAVMSEKISKDRINCLAKDVKAFLVKWHLADDVTLLYNGIKETASIGEDNTLVWESFPECNPRKYNKYAAKNHIFTLLFEGDLIYLLSYDDIPITKFDHWKELFDENIMELQDIIQYLFLESPLKDDFREMIEAAIFCCKNRLRVAEEKEEMSQELSFYLGLEQEENPVLTMLEKEKDAIIWYGYDDYPVRQLMDDLSWKITHMAKEEFDAIFEKYGLWYDFGNSWNITCYQHFCGKPQI
jgi:hypothetical protein